MALQPAKCLTNCAEMATFPNIAHRALSQDPKAPATVPLKMPQFTQQVDS